jgi:nucleoside-diphosphate-sugar epimerase
MLASDAKASPPELFVLLSSCQVYAQGTSAITEESPLAPRGSYGFLKAAAESMLLQNSIPSVAMRLSGVYGPGDTGNRLMKKAALSVLGLDAVQLELDAMRTLTYVDD